MGISRQAYYKQCLHAVAQERRMEQVVRFVRQEHMLQPRLGTRKLFHMMTSSTPIRIGRDRLFVLLRRHRLLVKIKRAIITPPQSHHRFHCHPNLLKTGPQQVVATKPEQVWVADIIYLSVKTGEAYLSLVTDAWSRKIMGY